MNVFALKKEDYIYKRCSIGMSTEKLSSFMYAVLMFRAQILDSAGVGIYGLDRAQNSRNTVEIKIHLHPDVICQFESIAKVKLLDCIKININ